MKMLIKEYSEKIYVKTHLDIVKELEDIKKEDKEFFVVFYLNTRNKIIAREIIHIGTLNSSIVHPREIFKGAIVRSSNSIILAHNHPGGDCSPSEEDNGVTTMIKEAGNILNIKLLDHVIVAKNENNIYSFNEVGLL